MKRHSNCATLYCICMYVVVLLRYCHFHCAHQTFSVVVSQALVPLLFLFGSSRSFHQHLQLQQQHHHGNSPIACVYVFLLPSMRFFGVILVWLNPCLHHQLWNQLEHHPIDPSGNLLSFQSYLTLHPFEYKEMLIVNERVSYIYSLLLLYIRISSPKNIFYASPIVNNTQNLFVSYFFADLYWSRYPSIWFVWIIRLWLYFHTIFLRFVNDGNFISIDSIFSRLLILAPIQFINFLYTNLTRPHSSWYYFLYSQKKLVQFSIYQFTFMWFLLLLR